MKLAAILIALSLPLFAAEKKVQTYEYVHGPYTAVVTYRGDFGHAVIYGPQFPYGIRLNLPKKEQVNIHDNVIQIVDSLAVVEEINNP